MTSSNVPWELRRRLSTWERVARAHEVEGVHHDVLCSAPESCEAYSAVIRAQIDLLRRAVALPAGDRWELVEALAAPGLSSLRGLVERAEERQDVTT